MLGDILLKVGIWLFSLKRGEDGLENVLILASSSVVDVDVVDGGGVDGVVAMVGADLLSIHMTSMAKDTVRVTSMAGNRRDHLKVLAACVDTQGEIRNNGPTTRVGYLCAMAIAKTAPTD